MNLLGNKDGICPFCHHPKDVHDYNTSMGPHAVWCDECEDNRCSI